MKHKRPDLVAKEAEHRDKTYKIGFGNGLFLWVSPKSKYWRGRYWLAGKEKSLSLGKYPAVGVTAARDEWAAAKVDIGKGKDPSVEKRIAKAEAVTQAGTLFEDLVNDYMAYRKGDLSPATLKRNWSVLRCHILPELGNIPAERISTPMVVQRARQVESNTGSESAHRVLVLIEQVYRHARHLGVVGEHNPGEAAKGCLRPHRKKHYPAILDEKRLGDFLIARADWPTGLSSKNIMLIAPHLMQRGFDIRHMTWDQLDLDSVEPLWTFTVRKSRERHLVPLSSYVAGVLRDLRNEVRQESGLCFPGDASIGKPVCGNTINKNFKMMGFGGEITLHSFRAIGRTLGEERVRLSPHVLELILNHRVASLDRLRGAYSRSTMLDARREAMQEWSDYVLRLEHEARQRKEGENVVPMCSAG